MPDKKAKGFSLLEIVIVVVIIGILAAIALPNYIGMKESEHDKDASANLKLIIAAEKIYRMEAGAYVAANTGGGSDAINANTTADITSINSILRLSLTSSNSRIWNYQTSVPSASSTCAQAARTSVGRIGATRRWSLWNTSGDQASSAACP